MILLTTKINGFRGDDGPPEPSDFHRQFLYRCYDWSGNLLYTGITSSPSKRQRQHAASACWWPDVCNITWIGFPTRADAERAEAETIRRESPKWNGRGGTDRKGTEVADLFARIGRDEICAAINGCQQVLSRAAVENQIPAAWYVGIRDAGRRAGIDVPERLFKWRKGRP